MRFPRPLHLRGLGILGAAVWLLFGAVGCTATAAGHAAAPSGRGLQTSAPSAIRTGACTIDQLIVTVDSSRSGQQTIEPALILTNRSTRSCTLQGTPVVALTDKAGGSPIGPQALQEPSQPAPELTLQPDGSAEADLVVDFPDKTSTPCRQRDAAGFAVRLPHTSTPIFVAYPYPACENKPLLAVFPLQPR